MKKITALLLVMALVIPCLFLQGCGETSGGSSGGVGSLLAKPLSAKDLSIDDFPWETNPSKYNGYDCYSFSMTNNSDYDIISVQFTYKVRDDVTDAELAVYDEFMGDHEGYIESTDSPRNVILRGNKDILVPKGEQLTGLIFAVGYNDWVWYDSPTKEQYELMEPQELQIGVVGKDSVLYMAYYNFVDEQWILDENTKPVDTWSDKEIAKVISRPAEGHHIVVTDDEDKFRVYSFGITPEEFEQYIGEVVATGFEEESRSDTRFEGINADGYELEIYYTEKEERLTITVKKDE